MRIWTFDCTPAWFNDRSRNTASGLAGVEITEVGDDFLRGRMPVDARTRQPMGILHGGMSVMLAESLASLAANCVVDRALNHCVGQEINANHVRSVADGWVTGTARPLHIGRSSQVWDIRIVDPQERLVCVSRITLAVLAKPLASR